MAETVVARLKAVLTGDSAGLRRDLDQSEKRLKAFGDKAGQVGRQMTTRLTLPLVGVGVAAVKTASDFERSMTSITALVGIASDEVKRMEGDVRSMAVQFGKSGKEAADALFFITSAGLRGSVATDTLAASLKASAIGLGDTATIADLATSALNAYGADVLSAADATDVMTATVREGKLEASELAGSMGRVLPLASAMGVEFNEVGAAFAALSRTGTNAAEAATQIRGILASLLRPTKQAEEALTDMGLSSEGLRRQMREEGLLATLKTLSEEFAGNEAAAASVFGNIRALSGVLDLMGANVATTEAIFESMTDTTGAVDAAFAAVSETASFKFQQAMAETKDSLLTLGQELMPMVTDALGLIRGVIESVTGAFSGMSDSNKQMVTTLLGVAAVAGPVALGIAGISKALVALKNASPWVIGLTTAFTGLSIIMGEYYREAREARSRQEALTQEFKDAGDPAANLTDRLSDLADEIKRVREEAEGGADAIPELIGAATLQGALSAGGVLDVFNEIGASVEDLIPSLEDGAGELEGLLQAFELGGLDMVRDELQKLPAEYDALSNSMRVALMNTEENSVEQIELMENYRKVVEALVQTGQAFEDNTEKIEADMQAMIDSGDVYRDFAGLLGEDTVNSLLAMVGNGKTATEVMQMIADRADAAMYSVRYYSFMADHAAESSDNLSGSVAVVTGTIDEMGMALLSAGEILGHDISQTQALVEALGILDRLSPEVRVALGLEIEGGQQILGLIDQLLRTQMRQFSGRLGPEFFEQNPAIQGLIDLRSALAAALANPTSVTSGGGGGGGSSPASEAIDEVARAAEEAQQQADQLSRSVAQLGDSFMGRNFSEQLFGASPDEIANIFENLVEELDRLGLVTEQNGSAIIALGEQFKAAASAAQELQEATEALAEAQDELARRKKVLADLKDEYAGFKDAFGLGGAQFKIAGDKDPLSIALKAIEKNLPKLEAAQDELDRLKQARGSFQDQVTSLFQPSLSPESNVMGQTQRLLGQAREFRDNLIKLRDKGFPPDVIAEVVNAGLQGGARLSKHLLRLGSGEMADFLKMREEIARIGVSTAKFAGEVLFGADIAGAEGEVQRLVGVVDQLYKNAIAEAKKDVDQQKSAVDSLTEALQAATAQMETLVDNIQVNLFNAFNNFLSKIGGEITTLTGTPVALSLDLTAIDRLTNLIADVTDTTAPAPTPTPGGGGSGGGAVTPTPAPAPEPEKTYTVKSGDGPIAIIRALTGSASGWASKGKKLWQHNGLFWRSSSDWQTIHAGQVLRVPALAKGGKARGGMPHLVGEMGPELFVPDSSGYVVPNHAIGGGGQTVNVTINTHAGMRAEDIVREIEKYTRRRGQLNVPTTSTRRF